MNGWRRRWPALLATSAACSVLLATCARPRDTGRVGSEPDLRIAVKVGAADVSIGGQGSVAAMVKGRAAFRLRSGSEARLVPDGRAVRVISGGSKTRYERLTIVSLDRSQFVRVDGKPYRGVVNVVARPGGLLVINELPMEAYLAGVVNAEMGRRARNEQAALEAQAIVSRTYALKNRGKFGSEGYDLRSTVTDQAYGGVESETAAGRQAVRATVGRVVTYRGKLITAFFHSTCGFSTASPDEAFRLGQPIAYLSPVSDRHDGGYYCDMSPNFRWRVEWDGTTLRDILRRTVPSILGIDRARVDEIRDVRVRRTGPSGRVAEARIGVSRGEIPVFGPDIRSVFERPDGRSLGSTAVQLTVDRVAGRVRRLTASGAGWGHGVGMCQWGAVGRARAGQDTRTIVAAYFPGTRIERRY